MPQFQPNPSRPPIVINIPDSRSPAQRRRSRPPPASHPSLLWWLVAITTAGVLFCGLFPFDFVFHAATATDEISRRFDTTINQLYTAGDGLENIVFFIPTGFALAAIFWNGRRADWLKCGIALASAVAGGALLSSIVELSQVFLVSRDPSLADICSNTTGAAVGFVIFFGIGQRVIEGIAQFFNWINSHITRTRLLIAAGIWLLLAISLPLLRGNVGSLAEWSDVYPLMIGNETTGDRGWNGTVHACWLVDHALSDDDMDKLFSGADPLGVMANGVLSAYRFDGPGPYPDTRQRGGTLHWIAGKGQLPAAEDNTSSAPNNPQTIAPSELTPPVLVGIAHGVELGAPTGDGWWLLSEDGSESAVSHRIAQTSAFSLVIDVQSDDVFQRDGPPRIFSISRGIDQCNLQLLQNADALVIRLRTSATGKGGSDPEFVLPNVFTDTASQRIAVTFANDRLLATSNRLADRDSFQFSPESSLIWRIYPRPGWAFRLDSSGQSTCAKIYRFLAIVPVGLLLACAVPISTGKRLGALSRRRPRLLCILVAVVILEVALLVEGGHRPPAIGTLLTTIVAGTLSVLLADRVIPREGSSFVKLG